MAKVRVIESNSEIEGRILFAFRKRVDEAITKSYNGIRSRVSSLVRDAVLKSPTTLSLLSGQLKADFGLTTELANVAVSSLVVLVGDNVQVDFVKKKKTGLNFSILIALDAIDKIDIKAVVGGSYESYGENGVSVINWLEWLLTKGTQVIIPGFSVEYVNSPNSRSGLAVMQEGGAFRVAPEHAGILTDNFITRAIIGVSPQIATIIKEELKKAL